MGEGNGRYRCGHTAIKIDETVYGFYPTDENNSGAFDNGELFGSKGHMRINSIAEFNQIYKGDKITSFEINMSNRQITNLKNYLLNIADHPGTYSLVGRNCTSVVIQALVKNGIEIIKSFRVQPYTGDVAYSKLSTGIGITPTGFKGILQLSANKNIFFNKYDFTVTP